MLNGICLLDNTLALTHEDEFRLYYLIRITPERYILSSHFTSAIDCFLRSENIKNPKFEEKLKNINLEIDKKELIKYLKEKIERLTSAHFSRGLAYAKKGLYNEAIKDYNKAIEIGFDDRTKYAAAYNNRGYIYFDLQKYNEAIKEFNKAIELDNKNKDAYCGLAITYYRLGDKQKAKENYKKAIGIR
jgi:tetratricopeptide (TPR) repeat protein